MDFENVARILGYRAYTTAYDQVVDGPALLADQDEGFVERTKAVVDSRLVQISDEARKASARHAEDLRDRIGQEAAEGTLVTIAISMSGSSRSPIAEKRAAAIQVHVQALENAGFKVQVLGYTTSTWNGGKSRKEWVDAGKPENPGRLCDLFHVVLKPTDMRADDPGCAICLAAAPGALKENVEGEGLAWAAEMIMAHECPRNALVSVVDKFGSVDDATLTANQESGRGDNFMTRHADAVMREIAHDGRISLAVAGLGLSGYPAGSFDKAGMARYGFSVSVENGDGKDEDQPEAYLNALVQATAYGILNAPVLTFEEEVVKVPAAPAP
jgi:cobalamin biosynthesis protein CobT